jgi:hypothetical protein
MSYELVAVSGGRSRYSLRVESACAGPATVEVRISADTIAQLILRRRRCLIRRFLPMTFGIPVNLRSRRKGICAYVVCATLNFDSSKRSAKAGGCLR